MSYQIRRLHCESEQIKNLAVKAKKCIENGNIKSAEENIDKIIKVCLVNYQYLSHEVDKIEVEEYEWKHRHDDEGDKCN